MDDSAAALHRELQARGETVATAESLTGGGLADLLTGPSGASASYVGGVVSYATSMKESVLGIPVELVASYGVVSAECAEAMAVGVRRLVGATWAISTTGVAGPTEQEGKPVGTVYVAVAGPSAVQSVELALDGDRAAIRAQTCGIALDQLRTAIARG
jgi:nicotinamide-nucleotide amidase